MNELLHLLWNDFPIIGISLILSISMSSIIAISIMVSFKFKYIGVVSSLADLGVFYIFYFHIYDKIPRVFNPTKTWVNIIMLITVILVYTVTYNLKLEVYRECYEEDK